MTNPVRIRWRTAVAAGVLLTMAAAGCGSGGKSRSGAPTTTASGSLSAKLPSDIATAREITVGSDVSYPPFEFFQDGTRQVQGLDYDLGQAIGAKLGVEVTFVNETFDGLIPALEDNRFNMIMSAMTDNKTRQSKVEFVDYFTSGTAILVKKGNPRHINSLDDLCGRTVALEKGTTQADVADAQSTRCQSEGKPKVTVLKLEKDTDALQQLEIGRSDADMNDFPVAAYNAQTSGGGRDFQVTGQQTNSAPYGIAFRKTGPQLRDAVQAALEAVIADGTYDQILNKWHVSAGALKTASINAGTGS